MTSRQLYDLLGPFTTSAGESEQEDHTLWLQERCLCGPGVGG
ncbi:hypothetical protein [Kitasatospora sp. NPDC057015]